VKALILTLSLFAGVVFACFGQRKSVVIGTMIDKPNAILVINPPNSDQGFLLPQLNTTQRLSIAPSSPDDDGLMVYDITEKSFYYWSSNAWVKGLGDATSQVLSYDPATQVLTLSGGGQVNLTSLKEIPAPTGNSGKFLTTDGTTLSWADINTIGDISSIIAGAGLSGGGTSGDVNLAVNTDNASIEVNGSNQLQVKDRGVTTSKIAIGAITHDEMAAETVLSGNILDGTIAPSDIGDQSVTPQKIQPGVSNNQVLVTIGGTVAWADQSTLPLNLSADNPLAGDGSAGNHLRILSDGITDTHIATNAVTASELADNAVDENAIAANAVSTGKIQDGAINEFKLGANSVTPAKIQPGTNNQVLVTNGTGATAWVNQSSIIPAILTDGATIIGNGTAINLAVGIITGANITDNTLSGAEIVDGSLQPIKIQPGTANQIIVTNGGGTVQWVNAATLAQPVNADGSTITGDGTAGNPLQVGTINSGNITDGTIISNDIGDAQVSSSKIADGAVTTNKIQLDAVTTDQLAPDAVRTLDIQDKAVTTSKIQNGTANQVLVTNSAGTDVQWTDQSNIAANVSVSSPTITGNGTPGNPLAVGTISTANIPANTIELDDMNDNSVSTAELTDNAVNSAKIANGTIAEDDLSDGSVSTQKIQDGAISLPKIQNGTANQVLVTNAAGNAVEWTNQSNLIPNISVSSPTITGDGTSGNPLAVGTLSTANIPDNTIVLGDMSDNSVSSAELVDFSVDTQEIADGAVSLPKLQNGLANQVLVTNATGTAAEWTDQSNLITNIVVDAATIIGNGTAGNPLTVGIIQTADINDNAVTTSKIVDGAVTNEKLDADAVTTDKIADNGVTTTDILDANVTGAKIAADAITTDKIAPDAVTTTDILDENVTGAKITGDAITTDKIAVDGVTNSDIQDKAVTVNKIQNGTANQVLVTNGAGTAAVWTDQSNLIPNIVVDAATIVGNGTTGNPLTVGIIQTADINDNAVTNGKLGADAVTTDKIAADGVTTTDILDANVTGAKIAGDAITTDKIAADGVKTADIEDKAVTVNKIQNGTANQVLVTNGAGTAATWTDQSNLIPNIVVDAATIVGNGTTGNPLTVGIIQTADINDNAVTNGKLGANAVTTDKIATDGVTTTDILDANVTGAKIAGDAITTDKIAADGVKTADIEDKAVTVNKIQNGTANQVLVTNGAGTAATWTDQSNLIPNIVVDAATIVGNGTAGNPLTVGIIQTADINDNAVTTLKIVDEAVTNGKLDADAVTTDKIAADGVTTTDILDANVTGAKIAPNAITTDKIAADGVTTPDIQDKAVTLNKILNGTANQVLVTNGAGTDAIWTDQSNLVPNIAVDGTTITGNGTAGNPLTVGVIQTADINDNAVTNLKIADNAVTNVKLNADAVTTDKIAPDGVTTPDIIDAAVTNPKIGPDAITTDKIQADAVRTTDIQNDAVTPDKIQQGTADQILATNGTGTNTLWIDRGTLPSAGDVTGTLAATTVARIQGRNVSNTAPTNGQALIWNSTTSAWEPAAVTVAPTTQYYSIDPSGFQALQSGTTNNNMLGLFESNDSFVIPLNAARELIAPVYLPHGAIITNISVTYVDNELTNMRIALERKPFATAAAEIGSFTTGLLTVAVTTDSFTVPVVADRQVDNNTYTYRIHVTFNSLLDVNSAALALSRIHGVKITYTK
jgi:hypothetical protein